MNYVSLIGTMENLPVSSEIRGGVSCSRFKLITSSVVLDAAGKQKEIRQKHDVYAWGKWQQVIRQFGQPNLPLALEGRLVNRYIRWNGRPIKITEIEVNDLVII